VGELLSQLRLDHSRARPSEVSTAVKAVVKNDGLEPSIHDLFDDFPNRFE
jgi:hypothetical protein